MPSRVLIDGKAHAAPFASTFGSLVADLRLAATDGRLLSVTGATIDAHADPGRIELNGRRSHGDVLLQPGDEIDVVDGEDHVEPVRRTVRNVGRRVGDPERTLARYPTQMVTLRGRLSGEIGSVSVRSRGRGHAPKEVALTFDDGPWPGATVRILRVLHRFHAPATFFMVGEQARRYPRLVRKVRTSGNEIGNHTFDHPSSLLDLEAAQVRAEMRRASHVLARSHIRPTLFRPPGGSYDDDMVWQARRVGMRTVLWSVDPRDWRTGITAKEVAKDVVSSVRRGSIVLLHDGGGDAGHTIGALPDIIRGIRAKGFRLVRLPPHPI
jgi:peptidoglycan/xylan/chitin deacetylase (PgdA/CDA1 family)